MSRMRRAAHGDPHLHDAVPDVVRRAGQHSGRRGGGVVVRRPAWGWCASTGGRRRRVRTGGAVRGTRCRGVVRLSGLPGRGGGVHQPVCGRRRSSGWRDEGAAEGQRRQRCRPPAWPARGCSEPRPAAVLSRARATTLSTMAAEMPVNANARRTVCRRASRSQRVDVHSTNSSACTWLLATPSRRREASTRWVIPGGPQT